MHNRLCLERPPLQPYEMWSLINMDTLKLINIFTSYISKIFIPVVLVPGEETPQEGEPLYNGHVSGMVFIYFCSNKLIYTEIATYLHNFESVLEPQFVNLWVGDSAELIICSDD